MKKLVRKSLGLWIVVVLFVLSGQAWAELFTNPGFEERTGQYLIPDSWWFYDADAGYYGDGYSIYRENDPNYPAYEGQDCVHMYGTDFAIWYHQVLAFDNDWLVGDTYYWGIWVKDIFPGGSTSVIATQVRVNGDVNLNKGYDWFSQDHIIPADGNWHYVEFAFTIPEERYELVPMIGKRGGAGDYLADSAYLASTPLSLFACGEGGPCDLDDLFNMAQYWLSDDPSADFYDDGEGIVDFKDFSVLAQYWLSGYP